MALIQCPECGNDVSDQAVSCPKCGLPMRRVQIDLPNKDLEDGVKEILARDGKIAAIRFYRERTPGMGLAEAKNYIDSLVRSGTPAGKSRSTGCFPVLILAAVLLCSLALIILLAR